MRKLGNFATEVARLEISHGGSKGYLRNRQGIFPILNYTEGRGNGFHWDEACLLSPGIAHDRDILRKSRGTIKQVCLARGYILEGDELLVLGIRTVQEPHNYMFSYKYVRYQSHCATPSLR